MKFTGLPKRKEKGKPLNMGQNSSVLGSGAKSEWFS
jgi:hypothetical protein